MAFACYLNCWCPQYWSFGLPDFTSKKLSDGVLITICPWKLKLLSQSSGYVATSSVGLGTKNLSAGEGREQFNSQSVWCRCNNLTLELCTHFATSICDTKETDILRRQNGWSKTQGEKERRKEWKGEKRKGGQVDRRTVLFVVLGI